MSYSRRRERNTQESIVKVAKSTPVLELLFLRNVISSTNDYKTRNAEIYPSDNEDCKKENKG